MEMPSVRNVVRDAARDVEYTVLAYRTLTRAEALQAVAMYQAGRKAPKKKSRITIVTVIGAEQSGRLRE